MNIIQFGTFCELLLVPLAGIFILLMAYNIARKNWGCTINRYIALALLFAVISAIGSITRALLFYIAGLDYLSKPATIIRHLELYFIIYFAFCTYIALWLLFQDPETNIPPKFKIIALPLIPLALAETLIFSWVHWIAPHIFALFALIILNVILLSLFRLVNQMLPQISTSKRDKIYRLRRAIILISIGTIFIIIGGIFRVFEISIEVAVILQSPVAWMFWTFAAFDFYNGITSRETYFFDELNQNIVYRLKLPLDTSLDDIFKLIEKNLNITKEHMIYELKNRKSISQYIKELSDGVFPI